MTPNVLRLVSRGKDHSGAMLPHLPKQWLRAPLTVEITCAADDDNATSLGDVDSFTLMFRELNADRLPGDDPEGIVWYSEEAPIAENLGKTKGPHARFELTAEDIANITEAKDYWIAVHAVVGADRILRAAGIIAFADDGFPAEAPTPSDPGDYYLTKAQADTLYAPIGGGSGPGATDISITQNNASTVTVNSNTGSDGTIAGATITVAGVMTAAQVQALSIKANLTGAEFSGDVTVPNKIIIRDTESAYTLNITGVATDDDLFFALPTSSGTLATQTYVTGITNGKVNKSGDTMTGRLTLPNITVTGSATFGTAPATSTISTLATAARTNQFPNAAGTFTVTGIAEGVPDKLGTYAKCAVAGGVTKGQVAYVLSSDGANPTFALANASSEASSSKTYGFIDRACANNGFGVIITNGILDGLSLAAPNATAGSAVWLATTDGGIVVGAPPAKPAHSVYLGVATKISNSGNPGATVQTIEVKVQNGYELGELHDVSATTATANQALIWNSATSLWTPTTLTISLVDGLQAALNGKAPTNNPVFTGEVTVPLLTGVSFVPNPPLVTGSLVSSSLTAARTWTLPDVSGTFVLQANTANGMSVGTVAGSPATVTDGQLWYDSTAGKFKFQQGGATADLGTMASQSAGNVSITGGSITGITDIAVADGGTGASTAAGARVNLDVPSTADLSALRIDIQTFGGPSTSGNFTWTKPANAKMVLLRLWGAGSGGASGICRATSVLRTGGGGGGGGGSAIQWIPAIDLPATVSVTVGAGTAGGVGTNNTAANHANSVQPDPTRFGNYRVNPGTATNGTAAGGGVSGSVFSMLASTASGAGGAGNTTGGAGVTAALVVVFAPTGGGGGGSAAAGNTTGANGGDGGVRNATALPIGYGIALAGGTGGVSGGASAGNGNDQDQTFASGTGGGGGAYLTGANGGNGGNGGWPGGGGGGGGAADDGFTAGSGGRGANGFVQVITYF